MFLKRIELFGFKSFADRTELEFVPGITSVVGPNGSGKSNISDGIRWVLGEQSAKSLRGGKMEDIIFSGSDTRKPVNFSEITITLDNSSQTLPLDYTEVTVTRRIDRNGDSEYAINKQPCRLKDVTELFMDTGIGRESYSIIGQGRIDDILSTKSEDRRGIFEEASGIVRYKSRKRDAERKLLDTEQNLVRIHDLVGELEDQVEPLLQQSKKASQFKSIKEQLKQIEIGVYVYHIESMYKKWTDDTEKLKSLKTEQINFSTTLSKLDADIEKSRWEMQIIDDQLQQLNQNLLKISEEFEKTEGKGEVLRERKKNYEANRHQISQSILTLEQRCLEKEDEINQFSAQIVKLDEVFISLKSLLQTEENQLNLTSSESIILSEEQLKANLLEILTSMSETRTTILFAEQQHQEILRRIESNNQEIIELETSLAEKNNKLQIEQHLLASQSTEIDDLRNQYLAYVQKLQEIQSNQESIENLIRSSSKKLEGLISRKETIKEMMDDFEGFGQGVKEVLKAKNSNHLKGIHGAIAELFQVPSYLEIAIETTLGAALQNIIVNSESDARAAISFLKQRQLGRATFLPLDVMKGRFISEEEINKLKSEPGYVGIANDLVEYSKTYKNIFSNMLGQIVVSKNLEDANRIAAKLQYRYRIVTLEGDVVNPGGAMTGGSVYKKGTSLLSRQRQLEELNQLIEQTNRELTQHQKSFQICNAELDSIKYTLEQFRQDGENKRLEEQQIRSKLDTLLLELEKNRENIAKKSQDLLDLNEVLITLNNQKVQSELILAQLLQDEENIQLSIRDAELFRKQGQTVKDEIQFKLTELKIKSATITQEKQSLIDQQRRFQQDLNITLEELVLLKSNLDQLDSDMLNQGQDSIDQIELLNDLKIKKQVCSEEIDFKRADRKHWLEKDQTIEHETRLLRNELKKVEDLLRKYEVSATRLDVELETILKKLSEEYELSYELAKTLFPAPEEIENAEQQVKHLKKEINNLGEVNLGSIEEYARVSERFNFLNDQKNDLTEAKTAIYQIISEMDIEMSRKFKTTFDQIRSQFEHVFIKLFGGGHADLILSDPDNLLDTGIEIIAQPPGKKIQNILLLSGGEKALTAIALLFSILLVKPVPFCILDEIDAALDEANVNRYANYLKEFSSKTQFIIVTHRKGTMEESDVLYGVTMENDGVSKLVSVKLENYEDSLVS